MKIYAKLWFYVGWVAFCCENSKLWVNYSHIWRQNSVSIWLMTVVSWPVTDHFWNITHLYALLITYLFQRVVLWKNPNLQTAPLKTLSITVNNSQVTCLSIRPMMGKQMDPQTVTILSKRNLVPHYKRERSFPTIHFVFVINGKKTFGYHGSQAFTADNL